MLLDCILLIVMARLGISALLYGRVWRCCLTSISISPIWPALFCVTDACFLISYVASNTMRFQIQMKLPRGFAVQ